ncbi:short-chain dehydrogenase reductase 2 [Diplodia corticola]|uniref:Short-chain dehydrogenase reductase 2 n=1 Tax=Diplodia corticola TaxID=236234 RepID=A0A1J9RZA1_9PEZI|nr:short-chain dehydrogenase reductase 2 [Diplodia corticola]OJD38003.1 short-chain dehydrogenase reductase 2 [Diplodia corticola]
MSKPLRAVVNLTAPVAGALTNPLITGPLLLLLTRAPDHVKEPIIRRLVGLAPLSRIVSSLKWIFALGLAGHVNSWLNSLATNGWSIRSDAHRWVWCNEIAVVTGGCSGIGEVVVNGLVQRGVKVAILDRCDITDPDAVVQAADQIKSAVGQPSILVNNAGIGSSHTILDTTPAQLGKIFGVNLLSHWYTCQALLPDMIKHNKGHVVTVASMASFVTVPSITDYSVTKSGALAFHEGLTLELRHRHEAPDVHTTVVHPGWTRTALVADYAKDLERHQGPLMTPEYVGNAILDQIFACRGNQLILPKTFKFVSSIRGLPNWMQERARDDIGKVGMGKGSRR